MAVSFKKAGTPEDGIKIYKFGPETDGAASLKEVLGGKGANLAEMASLGIPVPPGFTIPCSVSVQYLKASGSLGEGSNYSSTLVMTSALKKAINRGVGYLKECFGYVPLVSVRSGARVSMPGMMDTILNVGITQDTLESWKVTLGARTALDSYRRLIQMYSSVALGVPLEKFESILEGVRENAGVKTDAELTDDHLSRVVSKYFKLLDEEGVQFPNTLEEQLLGAIRAVFKSWNNPRAIEYRKIHGYADDWGTAVTIQSMVFGNMGDTSATGVLFSRCPSTGKAEITGEFLINAQGEDVVAGIRTPEPIQNMEAWDNVLWQALSDMVCMLEQHYKDMQDIEFTVQEGELYILQTRNGKRSPQAAFRIARDMAIEGMITKEEAIKKVTRNQLLSVMQAQIDPAFNVKPHLVGIAAGGGVVSGVAVFNSESAINCKKPCILVRRETDPDDISGMSAAVGVLTATGGLTSHAAVVARGMGKTCVVGATDLTIGEGDMHGIIACVAPHGPAFKQGDNITIDGITGNVWLGVDVPLVPGGKSSEVSEILSWAVGEDVSERLDIKATMDLEDLTKAVEAVSSKSVQVDTAVLEAGISYDYKGVIPSLSRVGTALLSFLGDEVIVDLRSLHHIGRPYDQAFLKMFGVAVDVYYAALLGCKVDSIMAWPPEVIAKTIVKLPDETFVADRVRLTKAGFKVTGKVKTVADLLSGSFNPEVSEDVVATVFGSKEAYETIRSLVESHLGVKFAGADKTPKYWYDFLNKVA